MTPGLINPRGLAGRMFDAANASPAEFRRSDAQEAPHRDLGATLEKIADDFGIHQITVSGRGNLDARSLVVSE